MFATVSKGPTPVVDREARPAAAVDAASASAPVTAGVASLASLSAALNGSPAVAAQLRMGEALNGRGLPAALRDGVERLSGVSLAGVAVHRNSPEPAQLRAHAFTRGNDIHIAPGQERHLPHEAWHVVQQRQGRVRPTLQLRGTDINDEPALEREAEAMGARAVQLAARSGDGPAGRVAGAPATAGTAVVQRVPDEREAERLRPENTDQEWVRFDVPGDGSCLFYSVFLSAVAVQVRAGLTPDALAGMTPAQVAGRVLDRAAQVLGVNRRGLRAALAGYQRRERQGIAQYWRQNIHDANITRELVGDIRSIIFFALQDRGLMAAGIAHAALDVPHQQDAVIDKEDVQPRTMAAQDGLSEQEDGSSEQEDEASDQEDEELAGMDRLHAELDSISADVGGYLDLSVGQQDAQGAGSAMDVEKPKDEDWLAPFRVGNRKRREAPVSKQRSKSAPTKKTKANSGTATNTLDRFLKYKLGDSQLVDHAIMERWKGIVDSIERWELGNRIPRGSALDRAIKLLILGKMQQKVSGNQQPLLAAQDVTEQDLMGLVPAYIDTFATTNLFAGQAALDALQARHGLTIRSHLIVDNQHLINSEDAGAAVNVLQTQGHFNVLIGPFVRGHLHGPSPELRDLSGMEWSLPAAGQAVEPVEPRGNMSSIVFKKPLLGVSALAFCEAEKGRHLALCRVDGDWLPLDRHLEAMIDRDDIARNSFQRMREFVGAEIESPEAKPTLVTLTELRVMLENAAGRLTYFEGAGEPTDAGLEDAQTIHIHNGQVYTGDGLRLATLLRRILGGPLGNAVTHRGAAVVHEALQAVTAAEKKPSHDPKVDLGTVSERLAVLAGKLGIKRLSDALDVRPMEAVKVPFLVLRPTMGQKRRFLARNNEEEQYDLTGQYKDAAYEKEGRRQAAIQQKYINRMTVAEWMMNRDLFGIRKETTRESILDERDDAYLQSLTLEMLGRAQEVGEQGVSRGKGQRLAKSNELLKRIVTAGTESGKMDVLSYMMERVRMIRDFRRSNLAYDPGVRPDRAELEAVIRELLTTERFTGRFDEDGEPVSEGVARDLVGRSNQQVEWRKRNQAAIDKAIEAMAPAWAGLFPNHPTEPGRGLHILHNPDQVAGGEREIPERFDDITEFVGPGIVNSALGGTWALPLEGEEDQPTLIEELTDWIVTNIPEEQWPLLRMNVVLDVVFGDGSRVVPRG